MLCEWVVYFYQLSALTHSQLVRGSRRILPAVRQPLCDPSQDAAGHDWAPGRRTVRFMTMLFTIHPYVHANRMIRDERDPRHASKAHMFDIDDAELADL